MSEVVTSLVIDADTSGADRFSQAMAGAEQAANSGVESVTGLNVGLVALGTGAIAALVGVKSLLDYVVSANKDLADMATVAHQVGLTLTEFQGIKLGGEIAGLNVGQINSGLEKSASLLNDASRNSNSLSKELEANGISIKNANGQLISENQLLQVAAGLISNAKNPGDQLAIAQMLGFTKEWVPLLEQGATAMGDLGDEAKAVGAVIDEETIKKAADFDAEWRKSSVEFTSYMKAAISGLLPFIDDLIERGSKWAKSFNVADIEKAAQDQLNALGSPLGLPNNGDAVAIKLQIPDSVSASWDKWVQKVGKAYDLLKWLSQDENTQKILNDVGSGVGDLITGPLGKRGLNVFGSNDVPAGSFDDRFNGKQSQPWISRVDPNSVPGFAASQVTEPSYPESYPWMSDAAKRQKAKDAADDAAGDAADGYSKVAAKDVAGDAVDRAIASLQKHTQAQLADAKAVGLGDAALAGFKADAAETAAVMANGGKETDAQVDKFSDLKDAAIAAADALAKAKVASQIEFNTKTAFLSASDVAIATQLKGIYGNDVPAALNSTYAAAIRMNDAFKQVSSSIETNLTSGLTDIVTGAKSAGQAFSDMGLAIVKALEQMIIKIMIVEPLMRSLQQSAGGLGIGGLGGLFGGSSNPLAGSVSSGTGLGAGTGGLAFPMFADGTNSAPGGWSIVGEKGPELVNLSPGAQVVPNGGRSASNDNRTTQITVNLVEDSSRAGQVQQSQNSGGGTEITAYVDAITAKNAANPGSATSQVLNQRGKLAVR